VSPELSARPNDLFSKLDLKSRVLVVITAFALQITNNVGAFLPRVRILFFTYFLDILFRFLGQKITLRTFLHRFFNSELFFLGAERKMLSTPLDSYKKIIQWKYWVWSLKNWIHFSLNSFNILIIRKKSLKYKGYCFSLSHRSCTILYIILSQKRFWKCLSMKCFHSEFQHKRTSTNPARVPSFSRSDLSRFGTYWNYRNRSKF